MNYLGHAYLSFEDPNILVGNMIGDFVKGKKILASFPSPVRKGILLHRAIDTFTDQHSSVQHLKTLFRAAYGLYSGAVVDTLLDYFIANDKTLFPAANDLQVFSENVLTSLADNQLYFPERFLPYFESMRKHNWLVNYRSYEGIYRSLQGLQRRSRREMNMDTAYDIFRSQEEQIESVYKCFMLDIISFVKKEIMQG